MQPGKPSRPGTPCTLGRGCCPLPVEVAVLPLPRVLRRPAGRVCALSGWRVLSGRAPRVRLCFQPFSSSPFPGFADFQFQVLSPVRLLFVQLLTTLGPLSHLPASRLCPLMPRVPLFSLFLVRQPDSVSFPFSSLVSSCAAVSRVRVSRPSRRTLLLQGPAKPSDRALSSFWGRFQGPQPFSAVSRVVLTLPRTVSLGSFPLFLSLFAGTSQPRWPPGRTARVQCHFGSCLGLSSFLPLLCFNLDCLPGRRSCHLLCSVSSTDPVSRVCFWFSGEVLRHVPTLPACVPSSCPGRIPRGSGLTSFCKLGFYSSFSRVPGNFLLNAGPCVRTSRSPHRGCSREGLLDPPGLGWSWQDARRRDQSWVLAKGLRSPEHFLLAGPKI